MSDAPVTADVDTRTSVQIVADGPASVDIKVIPEVLGDKRLAFHGDTVRMNRRVVDGGGVEFSTLNRVGVEEPMFILTQDPLRHGRLVITDTDKGDSGDAVVLLREILGEIVRPDLIGVEERAYLAQHEIAEPEYLASKVHVVTTCGPLKAYFADRAWPDAEGFIVEVTRNDAFRINGVQVGQEIAQQAIADAVQTSE